MKKIIVLLITFILLTSCGLFKKITGSKEDNEVVKSPVREEEIKKEPEKKESTENKQSEKTNEILMKDFYKNELPSDI